MPHPCQPGKPCPPETPSHAICDGKAEIDVSLTPESVMCGMLASRATKATVILAALAFSLAHWEHFKMCGAPATDAPSFTDEEAALIKSVMVFFMNSRAARDIYNSTEE